MGKWPSCSDLGSTGTTRQEEPGSLPAPPDTPAGPRPMPACCPPTGHRAQQTCPTVPGHRSLAEAAAQPALRWPERHGPSRRSPDCASGTGVRNRPPGAMVARAERLESQSHTGCTGQHGQQGPPPPRVPPQAHSLWRQAPESEGPSGEPQAVGTPAPSRGSRPGAPGRGPPPPQRCHQPGADSRAARPSWGPKEAGSAPSGLSTPEPQVTTKVSSRRLRSAGHWPPTSPRPPASAPGGPVGLRQARAGVSHRNGAALWPPRPSSSSRVFRSSDHPPDQY